MSEVVENVSEQNSAQSKEAAAQSTETVEATTNNDEAAAEAVPETVENADDKSLSKPAAEESSTSPKVDTKKTPGKRTPSKRMSFIERAQKESEELVKNMGGSLEIEGGRRTRSSTRGTPTRTTAASTPPPVKKARTSPASGASTPTRPRGRGRKIDTILDGADDEEEEITPTPNKKKNPTKGKKAAAAKKVEEDEEMEENSDEVAKETEKKSEHNEESKEEDKVDLSESKTVEFKEAITNSDEPKETAKEKVKEKQEEDKVDTTLEPVVEETQSQVAAELTGTNETKVTKEPENSSAQLEKLPEDVKSIEKDSPMQTGEPKHEKSVSDKKEPTPEPMEVDSSSKSNDAIEEMEDEVVEVAPAAETSTAKVSELNNVEKLEGKAKKISEEPSKTTAPSADIAAVANNSIEAKSVAATAESAAANIVNDNENKSKESTPAANDSNKTENDLCEPKIATSPPISAANDNSAVATPQTCK